MNKTILCVDDEAMVVDIMKRRLEKRGYKVVLAATGRQGVEKAKEMVPDMIVLDQKLPDMPGVDVCKAIRKEKELENIPVVMFTCHTGKGFELECLHAGAAGIIYKPVLSDLFQMIQDIFSGKEVESWKEDE